MAGNKQRIILGIAVSVVGVGTWWLAQSTFAVDSEGGKEMVASQIGDKAGRTGTKGATKISAGGEDTASDSNKTRPPRFRKPDREGMEALSGVLGGGFGFDREAAERDEEAYPRPASVEEAREMFAEARAAVDAELIADGGISEERKRELRHRSNLALSDLQDNLDLESPEGKTELNDARRSTRTSMIDLGPLELERRANPDKDRSAPTNEG